MKTRILAFLFLSLSPTLFLWSQETQPPAEGTESKTQFGIGVSLNPNALIALGTGVEFFLPIGFTNIYVPIMPSPGFRIEPDAGIFSTSSETSGGGSTSKSSSSFLRVGVGLFLVSSPEPSFNAYAGPRLGLLSVSSSSSLSGGGPENKSSEMDFFIGFCVGGEYLFSQHFSVGGEAQVNYISFGNPDRTPAPTTPSTRTQSMITNNAVVFFRWYY